MKKLFLEFCKCEEPKYMASSLPDRIYSCGICREPIKLGQCIDNIKMKIDGLKLYEIKMNEILSEVNSLLK